MSPACRRYLIVRVSLPNEQPDLINKSEHCIAEAKIWMKVNTLKLKDEKMRLSY